MTEKRPEYIRKRDKDAREKRTTERTILFRELIEQLALWRADVGHHAAGARRREITTIFLLCVTAVITLATFGIFYWQAQLTRTQIILDQRPWVSLDVNVGDPLSHDSQGDAKGLRWHVPLTYKFKNYGKSPATNVTFWAHLAPVELRHMTPRGVEGTIVVDELNAVCGFTEALSAWGIGFGTSVFPGQDISEKVFEDYGAETMFTAAKSNQSKYTGQFLVVACVTYDSPVVAGQYRTALGFYLTKKSGKPINLNGEIVSRENLRVDPVFMHGNYAK